MSLKNSSCSLTPEVQCPNKYCKEGEQTCSKSSGIEGCPDEKYCYSTKDWSNCTQYCPVDCPISNQVYCSGWLAPQGDCPGVASCATVQNTSCPFDAEMHCPMTCPSDHQLCEKSSGSEYCPKKKYCLSNKDENNCPRYCSVECEKDQILCPGWLNPTGNCTGADYCLTKTNSSCASDDIYLHCPITCQADEKICYKSSGYDGCPKDKFCQKKKDSAGCSNYCTVECASDQVHCPGLTCLLYTSPSPRDS